MLTPRPHSNMSDEELLGKATEWRDSLKRIQESDLFDTTEEYKKAVSELDSEYAEYFEEIKSRRKDLHNECKNS